MIDNTWPISQIILSYLVYIHLDKIYSLLFLCNVFNEVHEHAQ